MTDLQQRFWLIVMDVFHALGWRDAYLWALERASACTDWGDPSSWPDPWAVREAAF